MKDDIYKRLGINKNLKSERKKFRFRIINYFSKFLSPYPFTELDVLYGNEELLDYPNKHGHLAVLKKVKYKLGYKEFNLILYLKNNSEKFNIFLYRLEIILNESHGTEIHEKLRSIIKKAYKFVDLDLGYKFIANQNKFIKSGDEKLDEALITEPLKDIKESKYYTAKKHYDDALKFYLKKDYENSVTNAYSAIDSLVKTFLGKDKRVDKLKNELLSEINLPQEWKKILAHYFVYAHEYGSRHGSRDKEGKQNKTIDKSNAEAYIYMTGLIIRLILGNTKG